MPRTKLKPVAKRNRDSTENKLALQLKEMEVYFLNCISRWDVEHQYNVSKMNSDIVLLLSEVPEKILKLPMSAFKEFDCKTFNDLLMETNNQTNTTAVSNESCVSKQSKGDDGYLTEESTDSTKRLPIPSLGPLSTAKAKSRARRSKSASGILINQSQHNSILVNNSAMKNNSIFMGLKSIKHMTPLKENTESHRTSRSKYRTPMSHRVKAASADRIALVTPKVDQNTPVAVLRYPKIGETVISLSGSPVIVSNITASTANVNIPMVNGVLSVRPTQMGGFSPSILNQIDENTFVHLKQLQKNLNMIMNYANNKY